MKLIDRFKLQCYRVYRWRARVGYTNGCENRITFGLHDEENFQTTLFFGNL